MDSALLILAPLIALGMGMTVAIIRALRRRTYRRWPAPLRWTFFAIVAALVSLGAVGLVADYAQKWGALTAAWFILAPLARGIWSGARE